MKKLFASEYDLMGLKDNPDILNLQRIVALLESDDFKNASDDHKKEMLGNLVKTRKPVEAGTDLHRTLSESLDKEKEANTRELEQTDADKENAEAAQELKNIDAKTEVVKALSELLSKKSITDQQCKDVMSNITVEFIQNNPEFETAIRDLIYDDVVKLFEDNIERETLNSHEDAAENLRTALKDFRYNNLAAFLGAHGELNILDGVIKPKLADLFKDFNPADKKKASTFLKKLANDLSQARKDVAAEVESSVDITLAQLGLAEDQLNLLREIYQQIKGLAERGDSYSEERIDDTLKAIARGQFDSLNLPEDVANSLMPKLLNHRAFLVKTFKKFTNKKSIRKAFEDAIQKSEAAKDRAQEDADQAKQDALKGKTPEERAQEEAQARAQGKTSNSFIAGILGNIDQFIGMATVEQTIASRATEQQQEIEAQEQALRAAEEERLRAAAEAAATEEEAGE